MSTDLPLAKSFYFTAIDGVASFPEVMTAIRDAIAAPGATPNTVGRAVERDVAFASRLLRIVNAPAVGLIRPCASVPHAVTLMGMQRIGMHAEKVASLAALSQCAGIAPEVARRAAVEAAIARTIAADVGISSEQAFTAALLADIGVIAIIATQPSWDRDTVISCEEERTRIGFDHAELGSDIIARWNLPAPIPEVIRHHHDLDAAKATSIEVARYVAVLQAAEYLAPGVDCDDEPNIDEWDLIAQHPALEHLGIDAVRLARLWPDMVAGIEEESHSDTMPMGERTVDRPSQESRPRKKSKKAFYFAMAAAVAIPAAVGFELFFRHGH